MAATTLFSTPILTHHYPVSTPSFASNKSWQPLSSTTTLTKSPLILLRASSSSPTVDQQEQDEEENSSSTTSDNFTDQSQPITPIPIGSCKGCGKAEKEWGCNGEGRIQGGIATVPGLGWWPIKAYRPCPAFVATGGRYRRQGQSMDEVAGFGTFPRKSATIATTATTTTDGTETQSSEKKEGRRKFKR